MSETQITLGNENPNLHSRKWRPVIVMLVIVFIYVMARVGISAFLKWVLESEYESGWLVRDFLLNLPRLICGYAAYRYAIKYWGNEWAPVRSNASLPVYMCAGFFLIFWLTSFLFEPLRLSVPPLKILVVLGGGGLVVGWFEEITFRGALWKALENWRGAWIAILGSSLAFSAFHEFSTAQVVNAYPVYVFLFGLLFSGLRWGGISIIWLVALHIAWDTLVLFRGGWYEAPLGFHIWETVVIGIAAAASLYWGYRRRSLLLGSTTDQATLSES